MSLSEQAKMDKPLTQTEYRVRDMILDSMGYGNICVIKQAEIARQLKINPAAVSRALKRLIALDIVQIEYSPMGAKLYKINAAFCYKGGIGNGIKERNRAIKNAYKAIKKEEQQK